MRLLLSLFIIGLLFSCQQKKSSQDKDQPEEKSVQKPNIQRVIENTYNFKAYQQKENVALDLLLINEDSVELQIYLQPENNLQIVQKDGKFLYLTGDRVYEKPAGSFTDSEINLYQNLVQAYHLPYHLANFQLSKSNDTLQLNKNTTLKRSYDLSGKEDITVFLSPKTDLVKSIVFDDGTDRVYVVFNLFITVQKIPISMRWSIYKNAVVNQQTESRINVRKISYPDKLAFDFTLPEKAKPVQNK